MTVREVHDGGIIEGDHELVQTELESISDFLGDHFSLSQKLVSVVLGNHRF